jgi:hypothetical protein
VQVMSEHRLAEPERRAEALDVLCT